MREETAGTESESLPFAATGVILAGGRSSRMGKDKSLLTIPDRQRPLIEGVWQALYPLCREMLIVGNCRDKYNLPQTKEVSDFYRGSGPLGGIHAGLSLASFETIFVASCDLAFLNRDLANYLLSRRAGYDLVLPKHFGGYEPLCAVYHKNALPVIEEQLRHNEGQVSKIIPMLKTLIIEEEELKNFAPMAELFFNINTPEDYQRLNDKIKRGKQ